MVADPVIAAAGDIACDPASSAFNGGEGTSSDCVAKHTGSLLVGVDAVLPLGDLQYECGGRIAFASSYDRSWGAHKAITRPVPGNHEYSTSGGTDCSPAGDAAGYFDYFGAAAGHRDKGYYSYDLGAWHVVALNSRPCFTAEGCGPASAQVTWLRSDLAAHTGAPCTLAYFHEAMFASSPAGGDRRVAPFWDELYAAGVDVVLTSHYHWYERFAPQDPAGNRDDARGIRQFIVGTGGSGLSSMATRRANSEAADDTTHGVLKMTLSRDRYSWSFGPGR